MVKGKTKSGIKFAIDENIKDDARLLFLLTQIERDDVKEDTKKTSELVFQMFKLVFGSDEKLMDFMNAVGDAHGGVCSTEYLMAEMNEMFDALKIKN